MPPRRTVVLLATLGLTGTALLISPSTALAGTPVTCDGHVATIVGTPGDDKLTGTDGPDVIAGLGGRDKIHGNGGDDIICGGHGSDVIYGGDGADQALGGRGRDALYGAEGRTISHDTSDDRLEGGPGEDLIDGQDGYDRLLGGPGDDDLRDTQGGGSLSGGAGNDVIELTDHGRAVGGAGDDRFSLSGPVTARGGPGADDMIATAGSFGVHLYGGAGPDALIVDTRIARGTIVSGGAGHDALALRVQRKNVTTTYRQVLVDLATGTLRAGDRQAAVPGFEDLTVMQSPGSPNVPALTKRYKVIGTSGPNRVLTQTFGDHAPRMFLYGLAGNDVLQGGTGDDLLNGGPGHDRGNGEGGNDTCVSVEAGADGATKPCAATN